MIIDLLKNASLYSKMNRKIETALNFLRDTDLSNIKPGRYEIDGSDIFALMQTYDTKPRENGFWEAHRQYIDIQYVIKGTELIGYSNIDHLKSGEYDDAKDLLVLYGDGVFLEVREGTFVILMPHDAHKPGIAVTTSKPVSKIVVKVRV
ncbi:MAG: YhcH/YjgK/YiaL family protein [Nitrospirae bacterium]|nr:YhcH/YjgK/YiaL family protein [Nitrospirota bacterium]